MTEENARAHRGCVRERETGARAETKEAELMGETPRHASLGVVSSRTVTV